MDSNNISLGICTGKIVSRVTYYKISVIRRDPEVLEPEEMFNMLFPYTIERY